MAGTYARADPMGLVETMSTPGEPTVYDMGGPAATQFTVTISVHEGDGGATVSPTSTPGPEAPTGAEAVPLTRATVVRRLPGSLVRRVELRPGVRGSGGLYANLYLPANPSAGKQPSAIVVGGSGGGLSTDLEAQLLAARGYPSMALAYFGEPGLPASLRRIPLEYFATAVRHLRAQPGVDPTAIALMGWSRGSEAAALTASYFPGLVRGVVGGSPAYTSNPDEADPTSPSWRFGGRDLPAATSQEFAYPDAASPAILPVEKIHGPILLLCGQDDWLWPSCRNARALQQRLSTQGRPAATLLSYPDAGHFVVSPVPYRPGTVSGSATRADGRTLQVGGTYQADQAARADAWPKILDFLRGLR